MAAWDTAANIINDAAVEMGLIPFTGKLTDPFTSGDANIGRLCQLLKSVGRDLQRVKQWTHLQKECSFTTVQGTATYSLPSDFERMIDQTWWNRTNRLPLGGPLSPQEWQYLKARLVGVVFTVLFRPLDGQISLYPDTNTPGGYDIAFEYVSRWWVGTSTATTEDAPSSGSQYIWFEPQLVLRLLKLAFKKETGFEAEAAQNDYDATLAACIESDSPAPVLRLDQGTGAFSEPLIGERNIPITGWGS
jgi:hypothetical protein